MTAADGVLLLALAVLAGAIWWHVIDIWRW